ncbi:hypothetical protein SAMN05444695_103373 [Rhodococcus triatomae]|uniref:Uncharacterized protein n=1 Tax=Rhodococcus triatomae TaxID=300028 RepID=A0A1G8FSE9_9NOCA|nr:hypothetical protein SAMN05444695_103373 [Rhodococcus triatomae]
MADSGNYDFDSPGLSPDSSDETPKTGRRRPSALLLLAGLAALVISSWALAGPFDLSPLADVEFRWLFVLVAVVVGLVLVFSPHHRSKK